MSGALQGYTPHVWCCVVCGKDLTPTPEQLEALRKFGNPLRREPCLLTENGLHRVDQDEMNLRRAELDSLLTAENMGAPDAE